MDKSTVIRQKLIEFLIANKSDSIKSRDVYSFVQSIYQDELKNYPEKTGRKILGELVSFCSKQYPTIESKDTVIEGLIIPASEVNGLLLSKLATQLKPGMKICMEMTQNYDYKITVESTVDGKKRVSELRNKLFVTPGTEPVEFAGLISTPGSGIKSWAGFGKEDSKRENKAEKVFDAVLAGIDTALELGFYAEKGTIQIEKRNYDLYRLSSETEVYCLPGTLKIYGFKEAGKPARFV